MKLLRHIANPSQLACMEASYGISTECPIGSEIWLAHAGEDGCVLIEEKLREFQLHRQVSFFSFDERYFDTIDLEFFGPIE